MPAATAGKESDFSRHRLVDDGTGIIDELFHGRTPGCGLVLEDCTLTLLPQHVTRVASGFQGIGKGQPPMTVPYRQAPNCGPLSLSINSTKAKEVADMTLDDDAGGL